MKYRIVGTTLVHGNGTNARVYQDGDVIDLSENEAENISCLVQYQGEPKEGEPKKKKT